MPRFCPRIAVLTLLPVMAILQQAQATILLDDGLSFRIKHWPQSQLGK